MSNFGIISCIYIKFILLLQLQATSCYPMGKADNKLELKNEIRYPNGTVVGKYSYTDNEGNPISVKYYADNSSYGVELNSFKVIQPSTTKEPLTFPKPKFDYLKPMEPLLDLASEIMNFNNKKATETKFKTENSKKNNKMDVNSKREDNLAYASKINQISSPEYETYYQNEVKAPKQCEKDKVRVYLVKEKRKIRSIFNDEAANYCDQF